MLQKRVLTMINQNIIGFIGIAIAIVGIGIAIFQDELQPVPTPASKQLSESVFEKGAELLGFEVEKKRENDWVTITLFSLGFISIILGIFSWVKKEAQRISIAAVALGLVVVAWEYVLIGVVVVVVGMFVGLFS